LKGRVKAWAEALEADLRSGDWTDPASGVMLLERWWRTWSDTRVIEVATTNRDLAMWRNHIAPRWGHVRLNAITSWDIERWIAQMSRDGVGAPTIYHSVRLMRQLLGEAARHRLIGSNPATDARAPRVPKHVDRFLTREEYDRLDAQMPTDRDRAMLRLMAFAGLRWSEVAGLHHHRVDLDTGLLLVVEVSRRDGSIKKTPKSSSGQRYVPLVSEVTDALTPLMSPGATGLIFPGVSYTNWRRRVFCPAVERAVLSKPWPTIHDMRHTYGSWLAEASVSPTDIMSLMGHGSLRATERYLHSYPARFDRVRAALERPKELGPGGQDDQGGDKGG
jgi:site-specific recombinase XerC